MTTRSENSRTTLPPAGRRAYFLLSFIVALLALLCNKPVSFLDDWNALMQDFCLRTFNRECLPLASIFDMGSAESSTDHDNVVLSSAVMSEVHHQRQLLQQQQQNNQIGSAVSSWKNSFSKQKQSSKIQEDNDGNNNKSTYSSKFFSSNGVLTNTAKYYLHYRNATLQGLLDMRHISLADMTDRIAHSTPRLLALCNLILAVTYMLHCSVADFFLAGQSHVILENGRRTLSSSSVYLETLASYFFFKLLLVSAIVEPDALDAFILLIWYSIHSFLRSLLIQAHQTVTGSIHRGTRIPNKAIVLLGTLGVWNVCSGVVCYMLFREAGMHMVTILLAECVLLGVDLISNGIIIAQEFCEERDQLETTNLPNISTLNEFKTFLSVLKPLLNLSHYLHLWYMHFRIGIVGCIVLGKCHSYARKILREISNHRKKNMLNNQLHTLFPDADVCELKPDNVCCICLTALSSGTGVKRVKCGHMYHANCLRQVVERARSIEAARCPMCRCTMLENATQSSFSSSTESTTENTENINVNNNVNAPVAQQSEGENGALDMAAPANATNNQQQQQQQQQQQSVVFEKEVGSSTSSTTTSMGHYSSSTRGRLPYEDAASSNRPPFKPFRKQEFTSRVATMESSATNLNSYRSHAGADATPIFSQQRQGSNNGSDYGSRGDSSDYSYNSSQRRRSRSPHFDHNEQMQQPVSKRSRVKPDLDHERDTELWGKTSSQPINPPASSPRFVQRGSLNFHARKSEEPQSDNYYGPASGSIAPPAVVAPAPAPQLSSFLSMAATNPLFGARNDSDPMQKFLQKRSAVAEMNLKDSRSSNVAPEKSPIALTSNITKAPASAEVTVQTAVADKEVHRDTTPKQSKAADVRASPPVGKPSSYDLAWARMLDLCAQMEFAYVKHYLACKEVEAIQNKIKVLEGLPVGEGAYMTELKALEEVSGLYDVLEN